MSNITQVQGQSGTYAMGGQSYDIEGLMMALGVERSDLIEKQVVGMADAMKARNNEIKKVNDWIAELRGAGDKGWKDCRNYGDVKAYLESKGVQVGEANGKGFDIGNDGNWGKGERDTAVEYLKSQLDGLNSDSQLDMIKLQSLVNKRDQSFEMLTNLISKFSKTKDAIIQNIR